MNHEQFEENTEYTVDEWMTENVSSYKHKNGTIEEYVPELIVETSTGYTVSFVRYENNAKMETRDIQYDGYMNRIEKDK